MDIKSILLILLILCIVLRSQNPSITFAIYPSNPTKDIWENATSSKSPWGVINGAQAIINGNMINLFGLIKYDGDDTKPMGYTGRGQIGRIGGTGDQNKEYCPQYAQIFTLTNTFGLDCSIQVAWNSSSNQCLISLLSWSLPMAYYYTTGDTSIEIDGKDITKTYYIVDANQLWLINGSSADCECNNPNTTGCVHVYVEGNQTRKCVKPNHMQYVSLDGIRYVKYQAPGSSPQAPEAVSLTDNWEDSGRNWPDNNVAEYQYNGEMVSLSGSIKYTNDAKPIMGQAGDGLIGHINSSDGSNVCPKHGEIFKTTNGYGIECSIEIRKKNDDKCEIYLLSWTIPIAAYYTGADPSIKVDGTSVQSAYYIMNNKNIVDAGSNIMDKSKCKCDDDDLSNDCAKVVINDGSVNTTCVNPRHIRYVSLDGIAWIRADAAEITATGSVEFATKNSKKIWKNAATQAGDINPIQYYSNGEMLSLSGYISYEGTLPMGSDLNGSIGDIVGNAEACPSYPEIFAVTNGIGVGCTVEVKPKDDDDNCPIDLLAWSIPNAYYYTGAYNDASITQAYYVVDNLQLKGQGATPSTCTCENATSDSCFHGYFDTDGSAGDVNRKAKCIAAGNMTYVSLDGAEYPGTGGRPAYGSGDPHFTTFDGSKHHAMGRPRAGKSQFYYLVSCNIRHKSTLPFSMIGKHINMNSRSKITSIDYVTLELYDNGVTYLVFLSSSLRHYTIETDGVSSLYDTNVKNGVSLKALSIGAATNIGDRFVILVKKPNSKQIDVTLTIDENCQLIFTMKGQRYWSGRYRAHYIRIMPPNCFRGFICGLLGDFENRGYRSQKLRQCNGDVMAIKNSMSWNKAYGSNGLTWEKSYVDDYCGGYYDGEEDDDDAAECDETIKDEVIATCQEIRDGQKACCKSIGGDFCDNMQAWCEVDVCITSDGDSSVIAENVYNLFTEDVVETCQDCKGCFGPIPKLLYEFDGNLQETQSNGDDKYTLQTAGDAYVGNGVLNCDGSGDYAYNEYNLDLSMTSHSLEVLVSLDGLDNIGGGTISIDSTYTSNEPNSDYQHDQFDSIVYNELNDGRWFAGSESLSRTKTGVGSQETVKKEYIHLVTSYDVNNNKVKLYRNGMQEQDYTPSGFFQIDPTDGYRIMFCQRHMSAGGDDFHGRIKFGAVYDYALSQEDVEILYDNTMVEVFGNEYEVIGDDLLTDKTLQTGQALRSTNKRYVAVMQRDGNFVVYDLSKDILDEAVIFSTNTGDAVSDETRYLIYQSSDGNLVLYGNDPYSGSKYKTNIADSDGTGFLIIENDGSLVIYNGDDVMKWSTNPIKGGDGFIQFGTFRVGVVNDNHFSISSTNNKKTSIIFRSDGRYFYGPRNDWGLWDKSLLSKPQNVDYTENGIEFGDFWCLGMSAYKHLSITHKLTGKTAMIWRSDGTRHGGPRNGFNCWKSTYINDVSLAVGFIQFNDEFRIGYTGLNSRGQQHLSIASQRTCVIYRDDGTIHGGPRDGWAWNGWTAYTDTSNANAPIFSLDEMSIYKPYNYGIYHFIGIIILTLIVINIICIAIYCIKKQYNNNNAKKRGKYNIISLETTDVETDTDS